MITHIALFKLVHTNTETVEEARKVLAGLAGKIPQLRHFEVGANIFESYRSYDLAVMARFDSHRRFGGLPAPSGLCGGGEIPPGGAPVGGHRGL